MRIYLIRRFLLLVPTLIGISMLVFIVSWFVPGGPIEQEISQIRFTQQSSAGDAQFSITEDQIQALKELYGFDRPLPIAYWEWQKKAFLFNFGDSYRYQEPVIDLILERIPVAIYFGLITTIITYLVCIPLGALKAIFHRSIFDNLSSILVFLGYAFPPFIFGLIMIYTLGAKFDLLPISGLTSENFDELSWWGKLVDLLKHSIMPTICYLIGSFAYMTLLVKNSMLENLSAPFVRSAVARGLTRYQVFYNHALRNSIIPIAATFGQNITLVFTGSFLIEKIFNIDGMGLLAYEAVTGRDYPLVMGSLYMSTLLFLTGNIISDICLVKADPRINFS